MLAMFGRGVAEIMDRMSPLFEVLRNAAPAEPDASEILDNLLAGRLQGMRYVVEAVAGRGPLRPGLSPEAAAETLWALSSPEVHRLLTVRRGWSKKRYGEWLGTTAAGALLPG
jgi:hypothetical protein